MKSKIIKQTRKILALLLCAALVRGAVNWTTVPTEAADTTGLCEHHTEHDADCGYVEAVEAQLCTHVHNDECGYVEAGVVTPCTHDHNEDCGYIAPTEEAPCTHEHDGTCGYTEGTAAIPCDQNCTDEDGDGSIDHAAGCAYSPAVAGTPCSHNHNDDCGYAAASAGAPCTHIHDENCGYAEPTEGAPCTHEHDGDCGYVEAVEGQPCQYVCEICDTDVDADDEQDEDVMPPQTEEIMTLEGDLMPLALIPAADESQYIEPENENDHPKNTTINLFDYWITGQMDNDHDTSLKQDQVLEGINKDHLFIFSGYNVSTVAAGHFNYGPNVGAWNTFNSYVEDGNGGGTGGPRQGIVRNELTNGYPQLNLTDTRWSTTLNDIKLNTLASTEANLTKSLAYLFEPNDDREHGKAAYPKVTGLFRLDNNGYYYFDSAKNFAELNVDQEMASTFKKPADGENYITLYNHTWGSDKSADYAGEFFPFNDWSDLFEYDDTTGKPKQRYDNFTDQKLTGEYMNHYFGMTIETTFVQPAGGKAINPNTRLADDMIFEFSGDDDVWIFIDGVLVGDLGGIHGTAGIEINFASGNVTYYKAKNTVTNTVTKSFTDINNTSLKTQFEAAGRDTDTDAWENDTFAAGTEHTLKFFYLERGNNVSNCYLKFNLGQEPDPISVPLEVEKNFVGGNLSENQFTFELYDEDKNLISEATNDAYGQVSFDEDALTFPDEDFGKTFTYYIKEKAGSNTGIRYDPHIYKVTIGFHLDTVGTEGWTSVVKYAYSEDDGTTPWKDLNWTDLSSNMTPTFTNKVEPVTVPIEVKKVLDNGKLAKDQFTFELYNDNPIQNSGAAKIDDAKNDTSGKVSFPGIVFDETTNWADSFTYYITEKDNEEENITCDRTVYRITITFPNAANADWTPVIKYASSTDGNSWSDLDDGTIPEFHNQIAPPIPVTPEVTKKLSGGELTEDQFTFELYDGDPNDGGKRLGDSVTNDENGKVSFPDIVFGKDTNWADSFTYYIKEINKGEDNIIYDPTIYRMTISFPDADDDDFTPLIEYAYWDEESGDWLSYTDGLPTFSNKKLINVDVTIEWEGDASTEHPDEMVVELVDENGNPYVDEDGNPYEATLSDEKGWNHTWPKLDPDKKYIVREKKPEGFDDEFTSEGNEDDPDWDEDTSTWHFEFKHNRKPESPSVNVDVTIEWEGDASTEHPDEMVVELVDENGNPYVDEDGNPYEATLSDENGWHYEWKGLPPGKQWTVREKRPEGFDDEFTSEGNEDDPEFDENDNTWYVKIKHDRASDNPPNGSTPSQPTPKPKETIDVDVTIVWEDDGTNRPDEVVVELVDENGVVQDRRTLSKDNNWSYTWKGLPNQKWTVREQNRPGGFSYRENHGEYHFVFIHNEKLIQTGQLKWPIPFLAGFGIVFIGLGCAMKVSQRKRVLKNKQTQ